MTPSPVVVLSYQLSTFSYRLSRPQARLSPLRNPDKPSKVAWALARAILCIELKSKALPARAKAHATYNHESPFST